MQLACRLQRAGDPLLANRRRRYGRMKPSTTLARLDAAKRMQLMADRHRHVTTGRYCNFCRGDLRRHPAGADGG
jgi:hypothetical protein